MPLTDEVLAQNVDRLNWLVENTGSDTEAVLAGIFTLILTDEEFETFVGNGDIRPLLEVAQRLTNLGVRLR